MSLENNIPKGWFETTLGEVICCKIDNRGRNPKYYTDLGIPVIDNFMIKGNRKIDLDTAKRFVDNNLYENFIRKYLKPDDVIITLVGNGYGNVALAPELKAVIIQNTIGIRANSLGNNDFIFYNLSYRKKRLTDLDRGAAQPSIKVGDLMEVKLILPPLPEQKAIAKILTSFDDKIELLQAQNKTLETTAQTIFKEWFGKYQIGDELPEGWRVGKLGEEFDISIGRTPPRKEKEWFSDTPTGKKWISIKDIGNAGVYISETSEYLTNEAIKRFNIPIIPQNTTILSFKMTVGKLTITTEEMLSNEAIAHLKLKQNSKLSSEFIYLYLQDLDFNALGSTSSIVTAINSTMIKHLEFVLPEENILLQFDELIKPIFDKIYNNINQIQSLKQTRDTLLPKLMSGQLRVDEFKESAV